MIRLISSHVYKFKQKMTALFLAIEFALEYEAKLNNSVNFAGLHHSRKCFMFHPLLKASGLLLKLVFHRKEGSCLKRSLYVERKMTILWHMIMSPHEAQEPICFQLSAIGAYML